MSVQEIHNHVGNMLNFLRVGEAKIMQFIKCVNSVKSELFKEISDSHFHKISKMLIIYMKFKNLMKLPINCFSWITKLISCHSFSNKNYQLKFLKFNFH